MKAVKASPISYELDAADIIVSVGGAWDQFALQNDGGALVATSVIGTPLLKHVSGDVSRFFVRSVLEACRVLQTRRSVEYRCDAPGFKRFMRMTVEPRERHSLIVAHQVLRIEPLLRPIGFFVSPAAPTAIPLVRCTMCNRVKQGADWTEPDEALAGGLLSSDEPNAVIYGVCDPCRARVFSPS